MTKRIKLVREENSKIYSTEAVLLENSSQIKAIDNPVRRNIISILSRKPMYPAEISRELKIPEQKAYYHLKQLAIMGIVEVIERKNIRGTTAKKFRATGSSFAVSFTDEWDEEEASEQEEEGKTKEFLEPFIKKGMINSIIVVGSPDPHGPYRASARDGHHGVELAVFLGNHAKLTNDYAVSLDVNISIQNSDKNLIIVGGPVTNMITRAINDHMLVRFRNEPPWGIISKKSGKEYVSENTGIIARITDPLQKNKKILLAAGIRGTGTEAAVVALTRHIRGTLQSFSRQENWYRVVQGFDTNGDGKIDSIDFME